MFLRSRWFAAMTFGLASLGALRLGGCCPQCGDRCTPTSAWESPTMRATRALLLIDAPELHLIRIDGKNVRPACLSESGIREYYLPAGVHSITASFRYQAPVSAGLIGAVEGQPLTLEQPFVAGREYVAIYHEYANPRLEAEGLAQTIAQTLLPEPDSYWFMTIVDLQEAGANPSPDIQRALLYCSLVAAQRETARAY